MKRIIIAAAVSFFACLYPWLFACFIYSWMASFEPRGPQNGAATAWFGFIIGVVVYAAAAATIAHAAVGLYKEASK